MDPSIPQIPKERMSTKKKIIIFTAVVIILLLLAFLAWKFVYVPARQTGTVTPTPTPTPVVTPTPQPTPTPVPIPTTGTLTGHADLGKSKITKILIYNSAGTALVNSIDLDSSGNYSLELSPGDYKIDYAASPDLYPHTQEVFTIKPGQITEFDYNIEP
jgi:hypothetical protein